MTRKVILEDKDGEELVPYTELATNQQPGRVRPDGSSLVVNSNGVISVNGATGTEIRYLSGVTSGLQGQLDNTVHKTGNETITGLKTFNNTVYCVNNNAYYHNIPGYTIGTAPSTNYYPNTLRLNDSTGQYFGFYGPEMLTDGSYYVRMGVRSQVDSTKYSILKVGCLSDGTFYTSAPTPPTGDNSSQIATTAYVTNKVSTKADKASFQVVSALPANPDANTFYFIPE